MHLQQTHDVLNHKKLYVDLFHDGIHPTCECKEDCNEQLKFDSWKRGFTSRFVRGHNARVYTCFSDPNITQQCVEKRVAGYAAGSYQSWNKGLTKETSQTVARASTKISETLTSKYQSGELVDWRVNNEEKAKDVAKRNGEKLHQRYEIKEIIPWNKGLSHKTEPRLVPVSNALKAYFKNREAGRRISIEDLSKRVARFDDMFELVSDLNDYRQRRVARLDFKCKICDTVQSKSLAMLEECPVCFHCNPRYLTSKGQQEVLDFIISLSVDCELNNSTVIGPKHLDIYVPSKMFAIEFNGCYYHSTNFSDDKNYHQNKTDMCRAKGITLFHLFDDEWRNKRPLVEGMIKHRLGVDIETINARKCLVEVVDIKTSKLFFDANHLDGGLSSCLITLALSFNGRHVAMMALRKPFQKKKYPGVLEVGRNCSLLGTNVRGWLGKLTAAAKKVAIERSFIKLMTYVDTRLGTGNAYKLASWQENELSSSIRFWWTDGIQRFDRFKFRADRARGLTQKQVAEATGVTRIFGCKNLRFTIIV